MGRIQEQKHSKTKLSKLSDKTSLEIFNQLTQSINTKIDILLYLLKCN